MILPSARPTGPAGSLASWWPSSTAMTRPSASAALKISGGSRSHDRAGNRRSVRARSHGDAGLAQDADVPPGRAVGDAEPSASGRRGSRVCPE